MELRWGEVADSEAILKADTPIPFTSTCGRGRVERYRGAGEGGMREPGLVCGDQERHSRGLDVLAET